MPRHDDHGWIYGRGPCSTRLGCAERRGMTSLRHQLRQQGKDGRCAGPHDLVFSHIEAPDEASPRPTGNQDRRIEHIDKFVSARCWISSAHSRMANLVLPDQ
jgi:hypothetical protein